MHVINYKKWVGDSFCKHLSLTNNEERRAIWKATEKTTKDPSNYPEEHQKPLQPSHCVHYQPRSSALITL